MDISITFERTLYQAVIRFKKEHPGVLEARTKEREEKERREENAGS
ncbi:MAG: hypothetical protein IIV88_02110 [Erysipelotrichaceae bacterium]|nr:hypothetical protein [Erysipelotrichaceae bacterium]